MSKINQYMGPGSGKRECQKKNRRSDVRHPILTSDPQKMTPNRLQNHWKEISHFIKKEWPKISDTALKNMNGNFDLFLKYLKEAYNNFPLEEAKARDKIQSFLNGLDQIDN